MTTPETPGPAAVPVDTLIAGVDRVRAGTYRGQDRERLVTVTVDGDGLVVRVAFVDSIGSRDRPVVEQAVHAALRAAQQRLTEAYERLATTGSVDSDSTVDRVPGSGTGLPGSSLPSGVLSDTTGEQR